MFCRLTLINQLGVATHRVGAADAFQKRDDTSTELGISIFMNLHAPSGFVRPFDAAECNVRSSNRPGDPRGSVLGEGRKAHQVRLFVIGYARPGVQHPTQNGDVLS